MVLVGKRSSDPKDSNNNTLSGGSGGHQKLDKQTLNLLVEQFLGKEPAKLLVPSSLSHSTDLASCILSAREF